jgi:hypothetical protein
MAYPSLCALILAASPVKPSADVWWGMKIAGYPSGAYHERVEHLPKGGYRTIDDMRLVVGRLGSKVEMMTHVVTDESADGQFIACKSVTKFSKTASTNTATRRGTTITISGDSGGRQYSRSFTFSGPLYGPRKIERLSAERLTHLGDHLELPMFDALLQKPSTETLSVESIGKRKERIEEDRIAGEPGASTLTVDSSGRTVAREQDLPIGKMLMERTSEAQARTFALGGELPADLFGRTLARSNIRLPDPRGIERVKLLITTKRPNLGWPTLAAPNQHVVFQDRSKVILEVTRSADTTDVPASGRPDELKPNGLVQSDDPNVVRIVRSLVHAGDDPARVARSEQSWLAERVHLDAGVTVAPASETVKTHGGTCLAFAILLAAMERAAGIPSRVVEGLVYEQGMWGGHAWTEALIDGKWVVYDAALPSQGPADAARFSFARSSLADGPAALLDGGLQLFGNVNVHVLSYTRQGREVTVATSARPYSIDGNRYRNEFLGVILTKSKDGRFCALDRIYPDSTVVGIRYSEGLVRLRVQSDGASADAENHRTLTVKRNSCEAKWRKGQSLWTVSAEGRDPRCLLRTTLAHLELQ